MKKKYKAPVPIMTVKEMFGNYIIEITLPKDRKEQGRLLNYENLKNNVDFYDRNGNYLFDIFTLVEKDFPEHPMHPRNDIYFGIDSIEDGIIKIYGYIYCVYFNTKNGKSTVEVHR